MAVLHVNAGSSFSMSSAGFDPVSINNGATRGDPVLLEGQSVYYARDGVFEEFVGITADGGGTMGGYYLYYNENDEDYRVGIEGVNLTGSVALSVANIVQYVLGSNDTLRGAELDDRLYGFSGDDNMRGGAGNDAIYGNSGSDVIYGNQGDDTGFGGQGTDILFGGQGIDIVYGNLEADAVYGNLENDTLFGGSGDDALYGGAGDDVMFGNRDSDTLYGNKGNDTLSGGAATDHFFFGGEFGSDWITDFDMTAGETIILAGVTVTNVELFNGSLVLHTSNSQTITVQGVTDSDALSDHIVLL